MATAVETFQPFSTTNSSHDTADTTPTTMTSEYIHWQEIDPAASIEYSSELKINKHGGKGIEVFCNNKAGLRFRFGKPFNPDAVKSVDQEELFRIPFRPNYAVKPGTQGHDPQKYVMNITINNQDLQNWLKALSKCQHDVVAANSQSWMGMDNDAASLNIIQTKFYKSFLNYTKDKDSKYSPTLKVNIYRSGFGACKFYRMWRNPRTNECVLIVEKEGVDGVQAGDFCVVEASANGGWLSNNMYGTSFYGRTVILYNPTMFPEIELVSNFNVSANPSSAATPATVMGFQVAATDTDMIDLE